MNNMITEMISIFTFHVKNMSDRQPKKKHPFNSKRRLFRLGSIKHLDVK